MYNRDYESIVKQFSFGQKVKEKSLKEKEDIEEAIKGAFTTLNPRTMERNKTKNQIAYKNFYKVICSEIYNLHKHIQNWFNSTKEPTPESYDKWHDEACKIVMDFLNQNYEISYVTYGKAQKIVNMTMKYLYCFKDAKEYEKYFKYCHMALDSFTLEWFWRNCREDYKSQKSKKFIKKKMSAWSRIQNNEGDIKENNKDKKYTYNFYVEKIREFFEENPQVYNGLTPFQAEFFIWPEMQLHIAAEAFIIEMEKYNKENITTATKNKIKNYTINKKIDEIKKALNNYNPKK